MVTYGSWLPNDPRGSWSDFVASWELYKYGRATRGDLRKSFLERPELKAKRDRAQQALKYPPVVFDGLQARALGRGFAEAVRKSRLDVWACSILPEHVHLVLARGRLSAERMANLLKGEATKQLNREQRHPLARYATGGERPRSPWARNEWKVFLDSEQMIEEAIRYVEENPLKEGKPRQHWPFVVPFGGLDVGSVKYLE
jgi:REP element-mobilizing transposase RayT